MNSIKELYSSREKRSPLKGYMTVNARPTLDGAIINQSLRDANLLTPYLPALKDGVSRSVA